MLFILLGDDINKFRMTEEEQELNDHTYPEYVIKDNLTKCIVAGLRCEMMNSVLFYKCSVSKCLQNQFSTVALLEFFKHIELNHQFINWNRKCDMCSLKLEKIKENYFLKDALEHIILHHLVIKEIKQANTCK